MPGPRIRPRRSFIFTPGLRPEMFPKALASGADIVCVELEDGIAPKDKPAARANAIELFESPQADDGVERIVRISSATTKPTSPGSPKTGWYIDGSRDPGAKP